MKIVKRDGRTVEYDPDKIRIAIGKANAEVEKGDTVSDRQIDEIIKYIEKLNKKRMLVEDIQDIIEEKLMSYKKYNLAKHYIIYRYTRAIVRKSNTTDESIFQILRSNDDINSDLTQRSTKTVANQRDLIAGEISKDLARRMLLPEKISNAHDEGAIYFHDADFYLQQMINSSIVNIEDMLDNSTVINSKLIESPNSFQVACTVLAQIIASLASGQYGKLNLNIKCLGKYLRKSLEKYGSNFKEKYEKTLSNEIIQKLSMDRTKEELVSGVQTILYQINTLMTTSGRDPSVTLILDLENDEYIKENASIIEEILNQTITGMKNANGEYIIQKEPNLIYILNDLNSLNNNEYDYLTKLAIKCSKKTGQPAFVSSKKMEEAFNQKIVLPIEDMYIPYKNEKGEYIQEGRFNQGVVSINLPQVGLVAGRDESKFFEELDKRLDLCFETLMCRNHALLGTVSDSSPIHYIYGGISRLESSDKIDRFLKSEYSTISLGYVGLYELTRYMKNESLTEENGKEFGYKVMKKLKEACEKWRKETGLGFVLYSIDSPNLCKHFALIDRERFGSIKDVTNKGYYSLNQAIDNKQKIDINEKIEFEEKLSDDLGIITKIKVDISNIKDDEKLEDIVRNVYENVKFIKFEV